MMRGFIEVAITLCLVLVAASDEIIVENDGGSISSSSAASGGGTEKVVRIVHEVAADGARLLQAPPPPASSSSSEREQHPQQSASDTEQSAAGRDARATSRAAQAQAAAKRYLEEKRRKLEQQQQQQQRQQQDQQQQQEKHQEQREQQQAPQQHQPETATPLTLEKRPPPTAENEELFEEPRLPQEANSPSHDDKNGAGRSDGHQQQQHPPRDYHQDHAHAHEEQLHQVPREGPEGQAPQPDQAQQPDQDHRQQHQDHQHHHPDDQQQPEHHPDESSSSSPSAAVAVSRANEQERRLARVSGHDETFRLFLDSPVFDELRFDNVYSKVTSGKPFAIFVLCRCDLDDDWDIAALDKELIARGLADKFAFMFAQPHVADRFQMRNTYGLERLPALILDNIPIGQHVEKYKFPRDIARGGGGGGGAQDGPVPATHFADFFADFFKKPTPLNIIMRSQPVPQPFPPDNDWHKRGVVWELVGSTSCETLFESEFDVLLMLYNPHCPGCRALMPHLEKAAQVLGLTDAEVIVARIDLTMNDICVVTRFESYPTILYYPNPQKRSADFVPINVNDAVHGVGEGGSARDENQCMRPISDQDLIHFARRARATKHFKPALPAAASSPASSSPASDLPEDGTDSTLTSGSSEIQ